MRTILILKAGCNKSRDVGVAALHLAGRFGPQVGVHSGIQLAPDGVDPLDGREHRALRVRLASQVTLAAIRM